MNLMKKIAEDNNGKLLDTVWKGATKEYWFIDENNRKFSRTYTTMKNRGWINLKTCRGNPLEEMSQIAKSRNGKLLSTVWKGRNTPLEFMDSDGFVFKCTPKGIRIGQWLPDRGLVSEPICRQAFEHIFGYEFPKTRKSLDTKITKRKRCLELDGYCKELNIAFEYQGHPSHWNNKDRNYLKVSKVDEEKKYFCESLNIILIQVPEFEDKLQKWEAKSVLDVILQVINKTFLNLNKKNQN